MQTKCLVLITASCEVSALNTVRRSREINQTLSDKNSQYSSQLCIIILICNYLCMIRDHMLHCQRGKPHQNWLTPTVNVAN